jgi:hypothetical protein
MTEQAFIGSFMEIMVLAESGKLRRSGDYRLFFRKLHNLRKKIKTESKQG